MKTFDTPFGMGVYTSRFKKDEWPILAERLREAGVQWSREDVPWGAVEPEPGRFTFDWIDAIVDFLHGLQIQVYGILHGGVAWANPSWEHLDAFATYVYETVRHLRGRVDFWEVWNEPNRANFWNNRPNPDEYVPLLRRACEAAKQANPDCRILLGSMACLDIVYLRRLFGLGAGQHYDLMNIHPYRLLASVESRDLMEDLERLNALCQEYGCLTPTWLTELGWPTGVHLAVTEQTQAEYLVKAYIMALAVPGLEKCFWYDFRDDAADPSYWEGNLGLLRQDMSPKPAYDAFATMTRLLHGYDYLGPIDLSAASAAVLLDLSDSPVRVYQDGKEIVLNITLSDEPGKTLIDFPIHRLLPGEPTGLAMEVHADASDNLIGARVRDARGREFMSDLEYLNWHGWKPIVSAFAPDASREGPPEMSYPVTLVSLYIKRYHFRPFYLHEGDGLRCRVRLRNLSVLIRPRGFLFGKERRRVAVLWRPCGVQDVPLPLDMVPGSIQRVDLYGQTMPNDDPMVLSLSSAPQYVCFETPAPRA